MIPPAELSILLIEDNELDARTMIKGLAADPHSDFSVTRAGDLASAAKRLDGRGPDATESDTASSNADHFDCVLLDLSLPDSEGLASLSWLSSRFPDCPIVVLTGLDDPVTAFEAVQRGAQDYLAKQSARPETIGRSIRYAVARMHSELALRSATDQLTLLHDRERIARDLHDTVIQQLFATGMGLQSVLRSVDDPTARAKVEDAVSDIDGAIQQLREAIFGLHSVPAGVELGHVIESLAAEKAQALGFNPIVEVSPLPADLSDLLRHETVQVVNEGLSNVIKHARATAVTISVDVLPGDIHEEELLVVTVTDNGVGSSRTPFETAADSSASSGQNLSGRGLKNMAQRAADLNGQFHAGPGPGGGTRIDWRVPLQVDQPTGEGR